MGIQQMLMAGSSGNKTLSQIITDLGLTTNLKLCLDAGDANSYDPAVQTAKWLDTSGNGYDFYRGTSGVGDGAEPTFNGSAGGLSSAEYFSFDGGDYFLYDSANETWMNTLHKDGAIVSCFAVVHPAAFTQANRIFSTRGTLNGTGFIFSIPVTTGKIQVNAFDGTTAQMTMGSTDSLSVGAWNAVSVSFDEAAATNNCLAKVNGGAVDSFSLTYSAPSATDAAGGVGIGANGNGSLPILSGSRLACLAIWQGTALNSANLTALYDAIKGRFGL